MKEKMHQSPRAKMTSVQLSERGGPLYLSEKQRFRGTFCDEEKQRRDLRIHQRQQITERRKKLLEEITAQRKVNENRAQNLREQKLKYLQKKGAPKNLSSVPYDFLTLEYNATPEGRKLKHQDDKTKYRAVLRSQKLYYEQNRNGFNPVTGERMEQKPLPPKPVPPED